MDIQTVGPWMLLGLGVVTVIGALVFRMIHPEGGRTLVMYVFGVLLVGLGIWGPSFLKPYGEWIESYTDLVFKTDRASVTAFLKHVEDEKMSKALQEIGLNFILDHPIPATEQLLSDAANRASSGSQGSIVLSNTLMEFRDRKAAAHNLLQDTASGSASMQELRQLDPSMREMLYQRAIAMNPQEFQAIGVELDSIRILRPSPKPRIIIPR